MRTPLLFDEREPNTPDAHFHFRLNDAGMEATKLCPFCDGVAEMLNTWTAHYWMECERCGATVPDPKDAKSQSRDAHRRSAMRALDAWNMRRGE